MCWSSRGERGIGLGDGRWGVGRALAEHCIEDPGAAGYGGESGVAGQVSGCGERGAVADDGQDHDVGPAPESGHRGRDRSNTVGLQAGLELDGQISALGVHVAQMPGDAGYFSGERGRGRNHEGLGVEGCLDRFGQGARQARRARPHRCGGAVGAEFAQRGRGGCGGEQVLVIGAVQTGREQAFQGGVDGQQRVSEPVGQPGGLAGEVVVVTGERARLGEGLVVGADPVQRVLRGAWCVGDAAHRRVGTVGHVDAPGAGDRDGQGADRGRLIDAHQRSAVFGERDERGAHRGFVVGQGGPCREPACVSCRGRKRG